MFAGPRWLLVATVALSTGCDSRAGAPARGEVLRIGFGIGSSARDTSVPHLTDLLYSESLLLRDWDGRQTPRLATDWQWEDNGRALRLQLKPNVQMHDGTPLAADLVAMLLRPGAGPAQWGFEHVTEVTSPTPSTVLIRLTRPDLFLLNGLADRKIVHPDAPDVSTGPFRLIRRTPSVVVRRFDRYHGGASALAGVQIIPYDTPRSVWAALMREEVDAAQEISRDSVEFMERSSTIRTYPSIQPFYIPLVFNLRHHALKQVEVRRALTEALDRPAIIERAMRGRGRMAEAPIWPAYWAYTAHSMRYSYDPENAEARLDKAGFPLPTTGRPGEFRKRFRFTCMVYNEDPQYERIALMVQQQLFEIGVDLQIELVDLDTFGARAAAGDFDAFLMRANAGRSLDFTYRFWRSSLSAPLLMQSSGYTGADQALDQLRASTSEAAIRAAVSELAKKFYEDAPAAFIAWMVVTRAVNTRFVVDVGGQDPFSSIWRWRPSDLDAPDSP